jgi:hypothetical protein
MHSHGESNRADPRFSGHRTCEGAAAVFTPVLLTLLTTAAHNQHTCEGTAASTGAVLLRLLMVGACYQRMCAGAAAATAPELLTWLMVGGITPSPLMRASRC